jgi:hypothetical protein
MKLCKAFLIAMLAGLNCLWPVVHNQYFLENKDRREDCKR